MTGNIGEIIRHLRKNSTLTQAELAKMISYSREQIAKIESGHSEPSVHILLELSKIFSFNLLSIIPKGIEFTDENSYTGYNRLRLAIINRDVIEIEKISSSLSKRSDFKVGEPLQIIIYSNAIVQTYLKKDYKESITLCLQSLSVMYRIDYRELLKVVKLNETSYFTLFLLTTNLELIGEIREAKELAQALLDNFKDVVFTDKLTNIEHSYETKKVIWLQSIILLKYTLNYRNMSSV